MNESALTLKRHVARAASVNAVRTLWRSRDLRLLMTSEVAWLLGNRFYLIALPWLVLQLTGDVAAMGTAILLSGIPRVALMPVGGILSDRLSARTLMLVANAARAGLLAGLTWLVSTGQVEVWMLYGCNLAYGLIEAFFFPARNAMAPLLAEHEHLQAANAFTSGLEQFCAVIGPVLAGCAITWMGGVGLTLTVAVVATCGSVIALWCMTPRQARPAAQPTRFSLDLASSLKQVVKYVWRHRALRTPFLMIMAINVLTTGPLWIGLPMLVGTRLPEGAAALGLVTSALGAGALLGATLAGLSPSPTSKPMGQVWALSLGVSVAGLIILTGVTSTVAAAFATLVIGAAIGYANVTAITLLQHHTPRTLMGRMMSLAAMK